MLDPKREFLLHPIYEGQGVELTGCQFTVFHEGHGLNNGV
jgi:hypothetical protein